MDAVNAGITSQDMPPGNWRATYHNVIELASAQKGNAALHDTAVAIAAGQDVTWIAERIALFDTTRAAAFADQLNALLTFGRGHRQIEAVKRGRSELLAAMNNGLKIDGAAANIIEALQAETRQAGERPVRGDEILARVLAKTEQKTVHTGIALLDEWTGGMIKNEFVAWVAPYKARKTSAMANVILARLKAGDQVSIFSFDENQDQMTNRLRAMLITEYMYREKQYHHAGNKVSAKLLERAGQRWKNWEKPLLQAVEYANDSLSVRGKQYRLYDRTVCNGTIPHIAALCRMDAQRHGLDTIFVDHLQSLSGFKTLFEKVEHGSAALHELRGELNCRMWLLSQQNEAAIGGMDEGSYSPNTKGGGGLASSADTIIVSKYMFGTVTEPDKLRIELRQARYEQSQVYGYVKIHPASGWITPEKAEIGRIDPETWKVEKV
jgi:hypothetical protein